MPWSRRTKETLTLFFATDLHGSEKCFLKFLNAAHFYGAEALILGGDITGKALVPVVRRTDGSHDAEFLGRTAVARSGDELAELEKQIRFNGFYPYRCDANELAAMQADETLRMRRFHEVMRAAVARWMELADERLGRAGVRCIGMPGNDDPPYVGELMEHSRHVENGDGRVIELAGYQVLSVGHSNPTPWRTPRELPEDALEARIEETARALLPDRPAVFNLHVPPRESGLDDAPELRADLSLAGGAAARMVPVGSTAVRRAIERHQPVLGLHGHIHESRGAARIGRTLCLNPGSEYNVGVLRGVLVRLGEGEVLGHQFVAA